MIDYVADKATHNLRKSFWFLLLEKNNKVTSWMNGADLFADTKPSANHFIGSKERKKEYQYNYVVSNDHVAVELFINSKSFEDNKKLFDYLFQRKDGVEALFKGSLEWNRHDNKQASCISSKLEGLGLYDKDRWSELHNRMIESMCRLEKAIETIRGLNLRV